MASKRKKLGEILVDWGDIKASDVDEALKYAGEHGQRIGEALVALELCEDDQVIKALATQFGLEYIDLDKHPVNREVLDLIPAKLTEDYLVIPLGVDGDKLKVVITDPLDLETLDLLKFRLNREIIPSLTPLSKVKRFIDKFVNPDGDVLSQTMASIDQDAPEDDSDPSKAVDADDGEAPIVRLVNLIITEA